VEGYYRHDYTACVECDLFQYFHDSSLLIFLFLSRFSPRRPLIEWLATHLWVGHASPESEANLLSL
jgi:hypothetical protein